MKSDLLLMSSAGGGGLPPNLRKGLVAWYDPWRQVQRAEAGQTLIDYSGHGNHGILGATDVVSTDDPAWTGNSLSFDGVDDRAKSTANLLNDHFTVVFAGTVSKTTSSISTWRPRVIVVSDGISKKFDIAFIFVNNKAQVTSRLSTTNKSNITAQSIITLNSPFIISETNRREIMVNGSLEQSTDGGITDVSGESLTTILSKYTTTRSIAATQGECYGAMIFNRSLSVSEQMQLHTYLKRQLASRGVTIP